VGNVVRRLLPLLAVLLPLLAACGSGGSAGSQTAAVQSVSARSLISAAGATARAGSAHFALRADVSAAGEHLLGMTASGGVAFGPKRRSQMTARYSSPLITKLDGATMTIRMVGSAIYVRSPLLSPASGGRLWTKMSLDSAMPGAGALLNASPNPSQMLSYLHGVSSSIDRVGSATIRGVETTHYRAVVDYRRMLSRVPAATRRAMGQALQTLRSASIPMDVWLDGHNRVRRVALEMQMTNSGIDMTMSMRTDYFDFGAPVVVRAPPAGQISELDLSPSGQIPAA
jgi:hypothetical protein